MSFSPAIPEGWEVAGATTATKAITASGAIYPCKQAKYAGVEFDNRLWTQEMLVNYGITLVKPTKRELVIPVEWDPVPDQIVARVNTRDLPSWARNIGASSGLEMILRPKVQK